MAGLPRTEPVPNVRAACESLRTMTKRFLWGSRELQVQTGSPDPSHRKPRLPANYVHVFFQDYVAGYIGRRRRPALALGGVSWALTFRMKEVFLDLEELRSKAATTKVLEL